MEVQQQGIKEETFIQTGRRVRDGQLGRQDSQQGSDWWAKWRVADPVRRQTVDQAVLHSCADKPGGTTGK